MGAALHIGSFPANKLPIIESYYKNCALETTLAGRLNTGSAQHFSTLQQLIDNMRKSVEQIHVIVNHGNDSQGLLIPFAKGTAFNATGMAIDDISNPADEAKNGCPAVYRSNLKNSASRMGISQSALVHLAETLALLRKKQPIIEVRGCNIGKSTTLLQDYKKLFGALRITAPKGRMFYMTIGPFKPVAQTMASLSTGKPKTANTRRRFFNPPAGVAALAAAGPICIDIRDIDGHTNVDSESFMDHPSLATSWAVQLDGAWAAPSNYSGRFTLPVIWDDAKATYHCETEPGFAGMLAFA